MKHTMVIIAALLMAGCGNATEPEALTYRVTADEQGWATAKVEGYQFGDVLEAQAWRIDRLCGDCDPVLYELEVVVTLDGSVATQTKPGAEVLFVVRVLPEGMEWGAP